ncbi:MAG: WbqC family protein [Fibrobacteres bacterium]|nr:WbqC family protein [Fibrobacterota bacterium]
MKVAIHQPNFIPWLGYFNKIHLADCFVFLDNVQFEKQDFGNRNRIKTPEGEKWLTLPIKIKGKSTQLINECEIHDTSKTLHKITRMIECNYRRAPYFSKYFLGLSEILKSGDTQMVSLNMQIIDWACDIFGIDTKFIVASKLQGITESGNARNVQICKAVGATEYISGSGARDYNDSDSFERAGVKLVYSEFVSPEYSQCFGPFIPNLSFLDYLFNEGADFFRGMSKI